MYYRDKGKDLENASCHLAKLKSPSSTFLMRSFMYNPYLLASSITKWPVITQHRITIRTYSSIIFAIVNTTTSLVAKYQYNTSTHQKMIDDDAPSGAPFVKPNTLSNTQWRDTPQRLHIN